MNSTRSPESRNFFDDMNPCDNEYCDYFVSGEQMFCPKCGNLNLNYNDQSFQNLNDGCSYEEIKSKCSEDVHYNLLYSADDSNGDIVTNTNFCWICGVTIKHLHKPQTDCEPMEVVPLLGIWWFLKRLQKCPNCTAHISKADKHCTNINCGVVNQNFEAALFLKEYGLSLVEAKRQCGLEHRSFYEDSDIESRFGFLPKYCPFCGGNLEMEFNEN